MRERPNPSAVRNSWYRQWGALREMCERLKQLERDCRARQQALDARRAECDRLTAFGKLLRGDNGVSLRRYLLGGPQCLNMGDNPDQPPGAAHRREHIERIRNRPGVERAEPLVDEHGVHPDAARLRLHHRPG